MTLPSLSRGLARPLGTNSLAPALSAAASAASAGFRSRHGAAFFSASARPLRQPMTSLPLSQAGRMPSLRVSCRSASASASPAVTPPSRRYHSFDHPDEPAPQDAFSPTDQAILAAAARHIPEHGFSERALALGAREANYPDISIAIFADGVFSLVRWHLVTQRTSLAARSRSLFSAADEAAPSSVPLSSAEIARRVELVTWERLLGNQKVVGRWQEALAIMAQPSYVPASLRELALLSDEIWALAGDTAVDPTWYTKRASLSAIYAASELFMTTDTSPGFAATRDFLHRRLSEAQTLGGYVRSVGQWAGFTASAGVNVLRSKGVGI